MTPRAFRILLPCPPAQGPVEGSAAGAPSSRAPAAPTATEHQRLTDDTADLWRQLVHLCWETP